MPYWGIMPVFKFFGGNLLRLANRGSWLEARARRLIFIYEASNLLKRIELTSKGVVLGYAIFEILLLITT